MKYGERDYAAEQRTQADHNCKGHRHADSSDRKSKSDLRDSPSKSEQEGRKKRVKRQGRVKREWVRTCPGNERVGNEY